MILTKLTLHNFGIYAGRHQIDLAPKSGKPIILFGALNGSGKTTLLEGIQFGLFGKAAKFLGKGKTAHSEFLINAVNRRHMENSASVGVEFEVIQHGAATRIEVVRTWSLKANRDPREGVQVFRDGDLDEDLSERWSEISETFFPSQLSDLFFFDGERIESLAQPERCSELIRTGLNSLLGLDLVTDLGKTLATLDRRLKIQGLSSNDQEKLTRLETKRNTLEEQKTALEVEKQAVLQKAADAQAELNSLNEQLKQQGGDLYTQRDQHNIRQNDLINQIAAKREEMVTSSATLLPVNLVGSLIQDLETLTLSGVDGAQYEAIQSALQAFSLQVIDELTQADELTLEQLDKISAVHSGLIISNKTASVRPDIKITRDALSYIRAESAVQKATALQLLLDLGRLEKELSQVEKNLLAIPESSKLEPLIAEIKAKEDALRGFNFSEQSLSDQIRRLDRDLDANQQQFDSATIELNKQRAAGFRFELMKERLSAGRSALKRFEEAIRSKHIHSLELLIKEGMEMLLRKKSFLSSIKICPETFSIAINIVGEGEVPASKLSAGERQLLAVAVLWALARAAGRKLPTVIDTPLGRLDSKHRGTFSQHYFPQAGQQVILLSTDEEIVGTYYDAIKQHLSHEYLIEYDESSQSSHVSKGYFEVAEELA